MKNTILSSIITVLLFVASSLMASPNAYAQDGVEPNMKVCEHNQVPKKCNEGTTVKVDSGSSSTSNGGNSSIGDINDGDTSIGDIGASVGDVGGATVSGVRGGTSGDSTSSVSGTLTSGDSTSTIGNVRGGDSHANGGTGGKAEQGQTQGNMGLNKSDNTLGQGQSTDSHDSTANTLGQGQSSDNHLRGGDQSNGQGQSSDNSLTGGDQSSSQKSTNAQGQTSANVNGQGQKSENTQDARTNSGSDNNIDSSDRSVTNVKYKTVFVPAIVPPTPPSNVTIGNVTQSILACGPVQQVVKTPVTGTYMGLTHTKKIDQGFTYDLAPVIVDGKQIVYREMLLGDGKVHMMGTQPIIYTTVVSIAGSRNIALGGGGNEGKWGQGGVGASSAMSQLVTNIQLHDCDLGTIEGPRADKIRLMEVENKHKAQ